MAPFIDAYWELTCKAGGTAIHKILPDGCVDLAINIGDDFLNEKDNSVFKSEKAYLGGAITQFVEAIFSQETHLIGVRFKPSAFSHFYAYSSLHEVTNNVVELSNDLVPKISSFSDDIATAFDSFFHNKLNQSKHSLLPIVATVKQYVGRISVSELAKKHFTTVRQLERNFSYHIGLSPKEFINIIRYRYAQQLILEKYPEIKLAEIAFDSGYYDQAHLSNEIKKYSGVVPTNL